MEGGSSTLLLFAFSHLDSHVRPDVLLKFAPLPQRFELLFQAITQRTIFGTVNSQRQCRSCYVPRARIEERILAVVELSWAHSKHATRCICSANQGAMQLLPSTSRSRKCHPSCSRSSASPQVRNLVCDTLALLSCTTAMETAPAHDACRYLLERKSKLHRHVYAVCLMSQFSAKWPTLMHHDARTEDNDCYTPICTITAFTQQHKTLYCLALRNCGC